MSLSDWLKTAVFSQLELSQSHNLLYTHTRLDVLKGHSCQTHGGWGLVLPHHHVRHICCCPLLSALCLSCMATCPFTSTPEWLTGISFCTNMWLYIRTRVSTVRVEKRGYSLSQQWLFNHVSAKGQWRTGRGKGGRDGGEKRVRR